MNITFTTYMNKSLSFRKVLTAYCINKGNEAQETRNTLHLLDAFDSESLNNEIFRNEVFNWFEGKIGTLKLRDLSLSVGFDYWKSLKNSNIIDTFDSVQGIRKNESNKVSYN